MTAERKLFTRRYIFVLIATLIAVVCFFVFRPKPVKTFTLSGVVWTTDYHITYQGREDLNDSVQAIFNEVDASASVYNKQSLITAINDNREQTVDHCLEQLYKASLAVHKASGKRFDPTVMPLVNAWGFGFKSGKMPNDAQIDSILQFVGLGKTHLSGNKLTKDDPRTQFDFSSIAKGYACDLVGLMLQRHGVTNYMVEIGGEVVVHGKSMRGGNWNISVDMPVADPNGTSHEAALTLSLTDAAVATSGNYRKFKEVDGKRISHIVNPLTGKSEQSSLLSVTIVAPDCMTADAWATACMVMGTEQVKQQFEQEKKMGVMTISSTPTGNYEVWSNAAFAALVQQNAQSK